MESRIKVNNNVGKMRYLPHIASNRNASFRLLFERSPEAMLLLDGDVFTDCNPAAVALLGCTSKEEVFSLHPYDISPERQPDGRNSIEKACELIATALQQGSAQFEWVHRRLDGSLIPVEVVLTAIPFGERQILHVVLRDITARLQAEAILYQREFQLQNHRDHLDELVHARTAQIEAANARLQHEVAERKATEQALRRARDELRLLLDIQRAITSRLDPETILQMVADAARRLTDADVSLIVLQDEDVFEVVVYAGSLDWNPGGYQLSRVDSMAGQALANGIPFILHDVCEEPCVCRDLVERIGARSIIAVPLQSTVGANGIIFVAKTQEDALTSDDERVLSMLASGAAIALENAELYTQAQQTAVLEERQRLTRELHDAVTQTLFSANLIADVLPRLWERDPSIAQQRLEEVRQLTRSALAEMRLLLTELRPDTLPNVQLSDLLRQLAEATSGRACLAFTTTLEDTHVLPAEVRITFYRIAQEALRNIAKHARARKGAIHLQTEATSATLRIWDDGRGFDLQLVPADRLGLKIMRERAKAIGATLEITSQPGAGTEVCVTWET
jgi:two-component system nitrate/nitrite sensor histidine kinase NarX